MLYIKIFFEEGQRLADTAAYNEECPGGYSMMVSAWGDWLGLTISLENLEQLSYAEILTHCLYGMTWFGSSEDDIQDYTDELQTKCSEMIEQPDDDAEGWPFEDSDEADFKQKLDG
ncbi:MAG: hypothetical protein PHR94_16000 [Methylomonas lenta]|nr:hypothetical protein [Methylomonas lenta]